MNQIYLGQRAFGFAAAARTYFGKDLKDVTLAQAAMLAGLPKAPSAYNPVVNPKRAHIRQQYILQRMRDLEYITPGQYESAIKEDIKVRSRAINTMCTPSMSTKWCGRWSTPNTRKTPTPTA